MPASYTPRVILKFKDHLVSETAHDAAEQFIADLMNGHAWKELVSHPQFKGITLEKLLTLPQNRLLGIVNAAKRRDVTYKPPNFLTYCSILCPPHVDAEALVHIFSTSSPWANQLQSVYLDSEPTEDPAVSTNPPNRAFGNAGTEFLLRAPMGINAEYAWTQPGGDGGKEDGVTLRFFDIESNWNLNHDDLIPSGPTEPPIPNHVKNTGSQFPAWHGTAVLGIVIASDRDPVQHPTGSSLGITPKVALSSIFSYWEQGFTPSLSPDRANTIVHLLDSGLQFGDILLLEFQLLDTQWPGEVQRDIFDAIRLATAYGVVVIESAGNGATDLDTIGDRDWGEDTLGNPVRFNINRSSPHFKDSGAILVTAADSGVPHTKDTHNYGSRVDCYAWGDNIFTTLQNNSYGTISGTSGAAAIIAGAALSLQGMAEKLNSYRLSPSQIRQILSDPFTGTLIGSSQPPPNWDLSPDWHQGAGVMPDLKSIMEESLGLKQDIYVRDYVGDHGDPHDGAISLSPDIIFRRIAVADPDAEFGQGNTANRDNVWLSDSGVPGQTHHIYVRARNRGATTAMNVKATVYWSEPALLVTPSRWNLIGTTGTRDIPPGDALTVLPAITWQNIPGTGHYCFIAAIGNTEDPAPPTPADFSTWDPATAWSRYEYFIRVNNNITWRNFDVIDSAPYQVQLRDLRYHIHPFNIDGTWSQDAPMSFEVISRFSREGKLLLLVPEEKWKVLSQLGELGPVEPMAMAAEKNKKMSARAIRLIPHGRSRTREILIPERFSASCELWVNMNERSKRFPSEITIRQLYRDREVGRMTWAIASKQHDG